VFDLSESQLAAASCTQSGLTMPLGRPATPRRAAVPPPPHRPGRRRQRLPHRRSPGPRNHLSAGFFENAIDFQIVEGVDALITRFPVLAHWNFECDAGGDFESLMATSTSVCWVRYRGTG
jgi:hypothetical protein